MPIRKITFWQLSPNEQISYAVGSSSVCSIEDDKEFFEKYGQKRYIIFRLVDCEAVKWKELINVPCIIEFDIKSHENNTRQITGTAAPGGGQSN